MSKFSFYYQNLKISEINFGKLTFLLLFRLNLAFSSKFLRDPNSFLENLHFCYFPSKKAQLTKKIYYVTLLTETLRLSREATRFRRLYEYKEQGSFR